MSGGEHHEYWYVNGELDKGRGDEHCPRHIEIFEQEVTNSSPPALLFSEVTYIFFLFSGQCVFAWWGCAGAGAVCSLSLLQRWACERESEVYVCCCVSEPGVLVMNQSLLKHPNMTATLLDFLCRVSCNITTPPLANPI